MGEQSDRNVKGPFYVVYVLADGEPQDTEDVATLAEAVGLAVHYACKTGRPAWFFSEWSSRPLGHAVPDGYDSAKENSR